MTTPLVDPASDLARNVTRYSGRDGQDGQRWLDGLPERVAALAGRWGLTGVEPFANLSFNFVAHANQTGQPVVPKIGWADQAMRRESAWLSHFGRHTEDLVVSVLARDGDDAYLMRRLEPGSGLEQLNDAAATEILGRSIRLLNEVSVSAPPDPSYPTIKEWFEVLVNASEAARRTLGERIDRAYGLSGELWQTSELRLLHGDLHHANVLSHQDRWIVTDPHGVIGDPAHECAAMLRNALGLLNGAISRGVRRRVDQLADATGYDAARIAGWGYAQNVLSCVWSLDADPGADVAGTVAVIDALKRNGYRLPQASPPAS